MKNTILHFAITILSVWFSQISAAETTSQFIQSNDTLVVYTNVPGLVTSEFYTIKVRSAATNNEWVECYANITRSLWSTLAADAPGTSATREHYYNYVKDWSHTYSNIEMSLGSKVEVAIAAKNGFKIKGSDFTKANAHPAQKASKPTVVDNIVYFTINNPGQITIDINGQMDETNTGNGYAGPPIHAVSLFANPVMKKPLLTDANVMIVEPGVKPSADMGTKTIMYFKPGAHNIGRGFKLRTNKSYYIPGDAIVYGTFNNMGVGQVDNVRIYGYGTLCGDKIQHPNYDPECTGDQTAWKTIYTDKCANFRVEGINIMNPPMHTININATSSTKRETFCNWVKIITWRCNGDGIGTSHVTNDCFIRSQDDCSYVKGDKKRCVFWTDVNGAIFMLAGIPSGKTILIEDCDVIYPRHCSLDWNGGRIFAKRGMMVTPAGTTNVNVTFKDIRITDPFQTLETFRVMADDKTGKSGGFSGIVFKNITSVKTPLNTDNNIVGHAGGIWNNITFDNVVLGGKKILATTDFAAMGPNVTVTFVNATSVKDIEANSNDFTIYTNSDTNKLSINSKDKTIDKIQLIDITGKLVYSEKSKNNNNEIDLAAMANGLYIVKLEADNITYTKKFVKK